MFLTMNQRIQLLIYIGYGDKKRTFVEAYCLFNAQNPNRPPIVISTVRKTFKRFWSNDLIMNCPKEGRPKTATTVQSKELVMESVISDPHKSIRQLSREHEISVGSVNSILLSEHFFPYKPNFIHKLDNNDSIHRTDFCELMMGNCIRNSDFATNIIFTEESIFWTYGQISSQNNRYWSDKNPHWALEIHTQRPQKLNVW